MSIEKYLDVSTCHITQKDSELLPNDIGLPIRVVLDEYGFFVSVLKDGIDELKDHGFSDDFINVQKHALLNKCTYINLDRDGYIYEHMHQNNW